MCIVDSSLFAEKEPDMLTPFTVLMPANIRFGRGQAQIAAPWLAQQGGPILLVHGASPQRAAFLRHQLEALQLAVTTLAIRSGCHLAYSRAMMPPRLHPTRWTRRPVCWWT